MDDPALGVMDEVSAPPAMYVPSTTVVSTGYEKFAAAEVTEMLVAPLATLADVVNVWVSVPLTNVIVALDARDAGRAATDKDV
jgi:hypothetical protein